MGRTPVAMGSSVPPCPALAAPVIRLTAATTWAEVIPAGLSMANQPWIGRPRRLRAIVAIRLAAGDVARHAWILQQRLDTAGAIEGLVELEADVRREPQ